MSQQARPISDVAVSGWSPTPVYAQINALVPDDSIYVASAGDPNGDIFQVELMPLDVPLPGPQQLLIRWRKTDDSNLPVTINLFQGQKLIASRFINPSYPSFATQAIPLTAAEAASITDYTTLSVQVTTETPPITRRALGTAATTGAALSLTLANLTLYAGELLIVAVGGRDVPINGVTFDGVALSSAVIQNNSGFSRGGIYYLVVPSETTGDVVASWSSSSNEICLIATSVYGLSNVLDQTTSGFGSAHTASTGYTGTTSAADEYLHALCVVASDQPGIAGSWNNFTLGQRVDFFHNPDVGMMEGYQIVSSQGAYEATASIVPSSNWVALLATFK